MHGQPSKHGRRNQSGRGRPKQTKVSRRSTKITTPASRLIVARDRRRRQQTWSEHSSYRGGRSFRNPVRTLNASPGVVRDRDDVLRDTAIRVDAT